MGHRKKTGITIFLSIFVCLIGLAGSMAGSLRYGLRDKAVDTLTREWDLSQMQITKIAAFMSMAQFFVVMVDTPGIQEAGAIKLLDASYTRDYIAAKMRDYRDDLLTGNGKGRFDFEEIRQLEEAHREEVCRDLQYNITAEDMTKYETIWDNLGLADRTALEYYRIDRPGVVFCGGNDIVRLVSVSFGTAGGRDRCGAVVSQRTQLCGTWHLWRGFAGCRHTGLCCRSVLRMGSGGCKPLCGYAE